MAGRAPGIAIPNLRKKGGSEVMRRLPMKRADLKFSNQLTAYFSA
jgi:hypothetical protein